MPGVPITRQTKAQLQAEVVVLRQRVAELESAQLPTSALSIEYKQAEEALKAEKELLEQRVEERTADLRLANSQLAKATRLKDEFLANMSHELRTPLTGVLGLAEVLQTEVYGSLNERQHIAVQHIQESGNILLSLINDILDLSKIEAGKVVPEFHPLLVRPFVEASLRLVTQNAQKKHIRLSSQLASQNTVLLSDERLLRQVLVNLLSNAVKFTRDYGEVGVEVIEDSDSHQVCLTVWDTGIGIAASDYERLFRPFVQLDGGLARQYGGTGLGLSLVSKLVDLLGGGIRLESEPGVGSRFTVVLPWPGLDLSQYTVSPLQENLLVSQGVSLHPADTSLGFKALKKTPYPAVLLTAEDNELTLQLLTDSLEAAGFEVVPVRNGVEAVEAARLAKPDLILMDIQMPVLDGLEATRWIHSEPETAHTPVVALTALAMAGDRERCLQAGLVDYLAKPVNFKTLLQVIQKWLPEPPNSSQNQSS